MPKTVKYTDKNLDLSQLAKSVEAFSLTNGFETRIDNDSNTPPTWFEVQSMKTGVGRTVVGARRCLTIVIKGKPNDFDVTVGSADWGKNIAASLITGTLTLGLGFLWAGASAATYKIFEEKLWKHIEFQVNQLSAAKGSSGKKFCSYCGAETNGEVYCPRCKRAMI